MPHLLDTSVAIHLRDGDPTTQRWLEGLGRLPLLSILTRIELEGGVHAVPAFSAKRRRATDALLETLPVLDFDAEAAQRYAAILAETGFSRRKVIDRMIAAAALQHDCTLATSNARDFTDVPGLRVEEVPTSL